MDGAKCVNSEVKNKQREEKRKINEERAKNVKHFYKTHGLTGPMSLDHPKKHVMMATNISQKLTRKRITRGAKWKAAS